MIGGTMRSKLSLAALLAAGTVMGSAVSAQAADFGGDCCADLEERVAVLEATTARKGNRKVSLKIYGHVNQALLFWDDGVDSDTYVVDNDHRSTRIGFKGKAKINGDFAAGYKIELQFENASSASVEQDDATGNGRDGDDADSIGIRKAFMFVKSKSMGQLSWGLNSVATDDITHDGFVSKTTDHARPDWHYNRSFLLRDANTGALLNSVDIGEMCGADLSDSDACFDIGSRRNSVRYDTPTFAGFKLSAAWGENDFWDVALRYAGEFGDIKVKAAIGYHEFDSDTINGGTGAAEANREELSWAGSAGIMHAPTGLFAQGSYRNIEIQDPDVAGGIPEADVYYLQAGIKQKWSALGATAIWGEYAKAEDGYFTANAVGLGNADGADFGGSGNVLSTEMDRWGVGLTQWVDAAKMQLYVIYQHTEIDVTTDGNAANLEDFDNVVVGGSIRF